MSGTTGVPLLVKLPCPRGPSKIPPWMNIKVSKSLPAIGFVTALEDENHGYFGGYLVLSSLGRPLEFHCSTPVQPNQAQRILYGATLRDYVLADLIGQTLLAKSQLPVQAVLTDQREMLGLSLLCDETIACVEPAGCNDAQAEASSGPLLVLSDYQLVGTPSCVWQPEAFQTLLLSLISHVDLMEPFERIRAAIREAQRITDPAPDSQLGLADAA
ncbi:hypothetical protein Pr1d_01440 [Bythopirellula goksoeyrii]|uniref:Uncharacterized protein n=1 Tax=Bythopirellula goksoeyrii TaxID=1400387 RepID=A0A5B9QEY3_9BACT|nr:hypothetical protein Pr1d_01440 [Bythopirellula goksoeyrii]